MTQLFDVDRSEAFQRLRRIEQGSRSIFFNAPLHVPGLLQEPAYAEDTIVGVSGLPADDPEVTARVEVRRARHAALLDRLRGDDAPQVRAVLDESVLRRAPAGSVAMRRQIEHLIEVSRHPAVHIGVLPLERGPHEGLCGTFEVHDGSDGGGVFFEGADGDHLLDDDAERVTGYRDMVTRLMRRALTGEAARTLMAKLISG